MATSSTEITGATKGQRIDKWLWHARFFKTRTIASKAVSAGGMRLIRKEETIRIEKPSTLLYPDDQLSFLRGERIIVVSVLCLAERRGPAKEAQLLYEDLSPPQLSKKPVDTGPFAREKGLGRPTKKDRRALDAVKNH